MTLTSLILLGILYTPDGCLFAAASGKIFRSIVGLINISTTNCGGDIDQCSNASKYFSLHLYISIVVNN